MFRSSFPVTDEAFFDRSEELARMGDLVAALQAGAPRWLCVLGPRKVGKTSLLLELSRRSTDPGVRFAVLDVFEVMPVSLEVFRRYAIRVVDAVFSRELGLSVEALTPRPARFRAALQRAESFAALPPEVRADVLELPERAMDPDFLRACLELPEQIARALSITILVAIDEFQELAGPLAGGKDREILPLLRSVWQRHRRVAYVISGSSRAMLTELCARESSPFFQHFGMMEIGPFPLEEAIRLLIESAPERRAISPSLAGRAVDIIGGHPFYLQLLGETLTALPPPYDEPSLKEALQSLLFSRTGRLSLYFENEFERLVGKSTFLAAVLDALADGPLRLGELARAIHTTSGAAVRYVERLQDAVERTGEGTYRLHDPTFGLWLRWRRPGGTVVPMTLLGDEAEQAAAEHLAMLGFDLVYQSRASRGAFDLLATRGPHQLGVQVKRSRLPLRFSEAAWRRMAAESERFGWQWAIAAMTPPRGRSGEDGVVLLDPKKVRRTGASMALGEAAVIENVLLWLDQRTAAAVARQRRGGKARRT